MNTLEELLYEAFSSDEPVEVQIDAFLGFFDDIEDKGETIHFRLSEEGFATAAVSSVFSELKSP